MHFFTISILVLLLLGVVTSRHISYYDNEPDDRPIITKSRERRICAELCMAGLGGEPCGDDCLDVIPQGLPTKSLAQLDSDGADERRNCTHCPRKDACPLLCENRLGYPLCNCSYTQVTTPFFRVDYLKICSYFCEVNGYRIFGCDDCSVYKNMTFNYGRQSYVLGTSGQVVDAKVDWNEWCIEMCQQGDGGAACYCDLLPLSLKLD